MNVPTPRFPLSVLAAAIAMSLPTPARSGGFALYDQSARALGVSFSDMVAGDQDASVMFMNPGGLANLAASQVTGTAAGLRVDANFDDRGSQPALGQTLGATRANGGKSALVPSAFAAFKATRDLTAGVGVFAPFGLATRYDDQWAGRFLALKSEIRSYSLNGSLAWKVNDGFALGAGVERQHFRAELTNAVNYTAVLAAATQALTGTPSIVPGAVGAVRLQGDDDAWAYTLGLQWTASQSVRLGLSYRSGAKFHIKGDASFAQPSLSSPTLQAIARAALADGPVTLRLKTPDTFAAGAVVTAVPDRLRFNVEAALMNWSSIPEQRILRGDGSVLQVTPLNWKDVWRLSAGAECFWDPRLTLRAGITWDETPIRDAYRNARLPSNTYLTFATGARVSFSGSRWVDVGLGYTRAHHTSIRENDGNAVANGLLAGDYRNRAFLGSVQFTQSF